VKTRSHGIVVGYRSEDPRRYRMIPPADTKAGRCVVCRNVVYVNANGASALRERDADPICRVCDHNEGVEVDRSLIES
jgi:hypothetical protein